MPLNASHIVREGEAEVGVQVVAAVAELLGEEEDTLLLYLSARPQMMSLRPAQTTTTQVAVPRRKRNGLGLPRPLTPLLRRAVELAKYRRRHRPLLLTPPPALYVRYLEA